MITTETKTHCSKYKGCRKCPFVGNECVAPSGSSPSAYQNWLDKMQSLIAKLKEAENK
ncbi:MAG: hypothetical protein GY804_11750 [Alphaproteobacteria bacterium]|nr:hypothetical protein [Alphaproteobacteria bacterium]